MFRKGLGSTTYEEYVLNLFKKDEECFEYFKSCCRESGIDIFAIYVTPNRDKNDPRQGAHMSIFVIGDHKEYLQTYGSVDIVNEQYSKILRSIWRKTCKLFHLSLDDYYSEHMCISMNRVDFEYYSYFTREYKQQIKDIVIKSAGCEPRYIFASSSGYISIVFNEEQYAEIVNYKMKIIDEILEYTNKIKKEIIGDISLPPLSVNFYHPGMDGVNLWGLSRED